MTEPIILVSNDDGFSARGIRALASVLRPLGRVIVVAPLVDQSAVSHAMSLRRPLRLTQENDIVTPHGDIPVYAIDGTPTDAVYMAVHHILKEEQVALLVSGINHGANLGDDVLYSGTVSAAMEAASLGIPAVAFSLVSNHDHDFTKAAEFAYGLCQTLLKNTLPKGTLLNVNVPKRVDHFNYAITTMGHHGYTCVVDERLDPGGRPYYWIGGEWKGYSDLPGTDCNAVAEGLISVTPIEVTLTCERVIPWLKSLSIEGFTGKESLS